MSHLCNSSRRAQLEDAEKRTASALRQAFKGGQDDRYLDFGTFLQNHIFYKGNQPYRAVQPYRAYFTFF